MPVTQQQLLAQLRRRAFLVSALTAAPAPEAIVRLDLANRPARARFAIVQAQGGNARWRADGGTPNVNTGMILFDGDEATVFSGTLSTVFFYVPPTVTLTVQWK